MKAVELIVAVDKYGGFGKDGKIPWSFPADMKHFREVTAGGVCVMGRVTHHDMVEMAHERRMKAATKKKPAKKKARKTTKKKVTAPATRPRITKILTGRDSFVITSNSEYDAEGATRANNLREAVESLPDGDKRTIFVIGGEKLFIEALVWANKVHMTVIPEGYECDRHFNLDYLVKKFQIRDGRKSDDLMFVTYHRIAR